MEQEIPKKEDGEIMSEDEEGVFISRIISKFLEPTSTIGTTTIGDRFGCSRLERLDLNGNHLGWYGIRMVVGTIVGSRIQTSGEEVISEPPFKVFGQSTYETDPSVLLAGFRATSRARDAYRTVLQPPLSSQQIKPNRSLTSVGLYSTGVPYSSSLPRVKSHHSLNSIPNQDGFTQEEIEELKFGHIGECGWENSGWQELLERRLRANSIDKERLKKASGEILSAVRILGSGVLEVTQSISSTSSNFDSRQDTFPIRRLPSEIVVSVLRELDRYRDLSLRQFLKIIDFGCDRRTIGLGSGSHSSWIRNHSQSQSEPPQLSEGGLLPFEKLSFAQSSTDYKSTLPHFYELERLDEDERHGQSVFASFHEKDYEENRNFSLHLHDGAYVKIGVDETGEILTAARRRKDKNICERDAFFELTGCDVFEL